MSNVVKSIRKIIEKDENVKQIKACAGNKVPDERPKERTTLKGFTI